MPAPPNDHISAIAALGEPTRRRLYDHVARHAEPLGRDDAAAALDLPRTTAAFHLDRLVEEGLLDVVYERRSGRTGPGAGRPAKLYRRPSREVAVSLPERRYDLAGQLLAATVAEASHSAEPPQNILDRRAHQLGLELGRQLNQQLGDEPVADKTSNAGADDGIDAEFTVQRIIEILENCGYEPHEELGGVTLVNCPFHALAQEHTDLVCGMNLRLVTGLLAGVGSTRLAAHLSPGAQRCCVRLEPATPA
jgi:predicted ArsR family transcriptional regulator